MLTLATQMWVAGLANGHSVPLVVPASDPLLQSFVRIVNPSRTSGVAALTGYDDTGRRFGPVALSIGAGRTVHLNSGDLEAGNADKGLPEGLGDGTGNWRLALQSSLDLDVLAYMRSKDGFLTAMHDLVPQEGNRHLVATFNPASNYNQVSSLRLVNLGEQAANVRIEGVDDAGQSPGRATRLSIPPHAARTLTAVELESGGTGLSGSLGDGFGKWRLTVTSDQPIGVMSLLRSPTRHLSNLSTAPAAGGPSREIPLFPPASHPNQEGFVRLRNRSAADGTVRIEAVDEDGVRRGPVELSLSAGATAHFNSTDLENGNPSKGLSEGVGTGRGAWRLRFSSGLDIEALAYIRAEGGFLTSMHDLAAQVDGSHRIPTFNPRSNYRQVSQLRLMNPDARAIEVVIRGVDDAGTPSGPVRATVPAGAVRTLTAEQLESGAGLSGRLGDGVGKWALTVSSDLPFRTMSLMESPTGHLANLSAEPLRGVPTPLARIVGAAFSDSAGALPLTNANCELLSMGGVSLAVATTDGQGGYAIDAPPGLQGFLRCAPSSLPRLGLEAYLAAQPAAGDASGHRVSPSTTVLAILLKAEWARNSSIDVASRARALADALADDADFALLADVAERLFDVLREDGIDEPLPTLLLDAFANGQVDRLRPSAVASALSAAIDEAEDAAGVELAAAASRAFGGTVALSEPALLPDDPSDLGRLADGFRTEEFARNPSLAEMNAHWAYARGVTGQGEVIGMTDTGIYAAHHEFQGRLHGETIYTVIDGDMDGDGAPDHSYWRLADHPLAGAYPANAQPDDRTCSEALCKFYDYSHGSQMASIAAGARNDIDAHGLAFDAKLVFWPFRQRGSGRIGRIHYHPPDGSNGETSRHDLVRQVGVLAPIVSNSWLTGGSTFSIDPDLPSYYYPFHEVLPQRYLGYQQDRNPTQRAMLLWSAGNLPIPGGPLTGNASVPSLTERQVRAASDGAIGLAELLLTDAQRQGLSDTEATQKAERLLDGLKAHWLSVTALSSFPDNPETFYALKACAADPRAGACRPNHTMGTASRCGFASDWCVAAGTAWGGVFLNIWQPPEGQDDYSLDAYRSSEASAAAAGALGLALQAYRDADGTLMVATRDVLKRLKATANAKVFDYDARHSFDGRNLLRIEEELIRSLIQYAGATDDELQSLVDTAKQELADLLPDIPDHRLSHQETHDRYRKPFTPTERNQIADAKRSLSEEQWARFRMLNRLVELSLYWEEIDIFPPQLQRVRALLRESEASNERANDLLARLIRQVEWIDEQLRRRGKTQRTLTNAEIRQITVTSMIGHGLIDLKAATDPAR